MSKKIIAIDMDDTLCWLMRALMEDHNRKFPEHELEYEELVAFDESNFHPDYDKFEYFDTPGTFLNLELMDEYVVPEMKKLCEEYDVLIVTSSFPKAVSDKWDWLQEHLPFIPHSNFCTFSRKDLIEADLLIDDAIHNVEKWVAKGKPAIVPHHHWNEELDNLSGVTMVYGWHGMKEIVDFVLTDIKSPLR